MDSRIKSAFDSIRAEDELKESTAEYLRSEIARRERNHPRRLPRFAVLTACLVLIIALGRFSHGAYFTPAAYVDIDVNPSIALELNRFDRVVGASARNDEGSLILGEVNMRNKSCDTAVESLLLSMKDRGYLDDGLVSVTVQADGGSHEANLLSRLQETVSVILGDRRPDTSMEVFGIPDELRSDAYENGLSPAKYIAILELQEVDETATFEGCAGHSISEIRDLTRQHGEGHHSEPPVNPSPEPNSGGHSDHGSDPRHHGSSHS